MNDDRPLSIPVEYVHKPVGLCGVSAGGFGGTRVVESLLPVMRELGMVTIFWDVNVSGAGKVFDGSGQIVGPGLTAAYRQNAGRVGLDGARAALWARTRFSRVRSKTTWLLQCGCAAQGAGQR